MNLPTFFRGMPLVARQEFLANLKSIRLIIMVLILALAVVGGSYGLSGGTGGAGLDPVTVWGHPALEANTTRLAVAFVSDPFGAPLVGRAVEFANESGIPGEASTVLGTVQTDADGFARLAVGNATFIRMTTTQGQFQAVDRVAFYLPPSNFTFRLATFDYNEDGIYNDVGVHVLDRSGGPVPASLYVNGTFVKTVDSVGYGRLDLPVGLSNVTIEVAGERAEQTIPVGENPFGSLFGTPDATLYILSAFFLYLIVPIFAIVVTFDAVSKERVQGTLDLLLSRPVSRTGVLLGKFFGSFAAVAFPITAVNAIGIGVITATSGKSPSGGFVAAFFLLTLLLAAFYVLLQLIFSTLAKTSGTAVLFGVLVWLLFNILYSVIVFIGGSLIGDPAARFQFQTYAGLGNPSSIYQQLVALYAPSGFFGFGGGSVLGADVLVPAAVAWLAALLILALWVFERKAAV